MRDGRIVVAQFWHNYNGQVADGADVIGTVSSKGYENICIYLHKNSNINNYFNQKFGISDYYITGKQQWFFNIAAVFKLAKILKENKVDILHCRSPKALVYAAMAVKIAAVDALIYHIATFDDIDDKLSLRHKKAIAKCDKIITEGHALREKAISKYPFVSEDKFSIVNTSIDCRSLLAEGVAKEQLRNDFGLAQESLIFGSIGKITDDIDGFVRLITAFDTVKDEIDNAHLVIAGREKFVESLSEFVKQSKYSDSIHLICTAEKWEKLLGAFDIFILPTVAAKPLPVRVISAVAMRLACIVPKTGEMELFFENNRGGFCFDLTNDKALAEAMINLASSAHNKFLAMVTAGRAFVELEYDHSRAAEQLIEIYSEISSCKS